MLGCQLYDLNQVEVSFKANPGHFRINVKKIWTHLDSFRACKEYPAPEALRGCRIFFMASNSDPVEVCTRQTDTCDVRENCSVAKCHSPQSYPMYEIND